MRLLLLAGVGLIFGLLVGRWWSVLVPPVVALIVFNASFDPSAGDDTTGLVFFAAAFVEVGVVWGVLLRKIARK